MFFGKRKILIKSESRDVLPRILHLATVGICKMRKNSQSLGKGTLIA
jgi:hypothetical protein